MQNFPKWGKRRWHMSTANLEHEIANSSVVSFTILLKISLNILFCAKYSKESRKNKTITLEFKTRIFYDIYYFTNFKNFRQQKLAFLIETLTSKLLYCDSLLM